MSEAAARSCQECRRQVRSATGASSTHIIARSSTALVCRSLYSAANITGKLLRIRAPVKFSTLQVPGLYHYRAFQAKADQARMQALLELEGFFESGNQVMLFGTDHIPAWLLELSARIPLEQFPERVWSLRMLCTALHLNGLHRLVCMPRVSNTNMRPSVLNGEIDALCCSALLFHRFKTGMHLTL